MNILLIPENFFPTVGGAEISVHNIGKFMTKKGHNCYVLISSNDFNYLKNKNLIDLFNYKFIIIHSSRIKLGKILKKLKLPYLWIFKSFVKKTQKKYNIQLWHFNLILFKAFALVPILKKLKIPTIGTYRGVDIQKLPDVNYGIRIDKSVDSFVSNFINNFDALTSISNSVYKEYKNINVKNEKITKIPNGIDINRFDLSSKIDKNYYNTTNSKKIILTVGRNHPKKNFDLIPEIIKKLSKTRTDFVWFIVGAGNEKIIEESRIIGVSDYIKVFAPNFNMHNNKLEFPSRKIINFYKVSDVFVFPTLIETFGNIYLESMAANLPIVTTDAPGARDIIKNNFNGLVSNIGDVESLAFNTNLLLNNNILRKSLIKNGRNFIKDFDWKLVSSKFEELYKKTIDY